MIVGPMNQRLRMIRRITENDSRQSIVVDSAEQWFSAHFASQEEGDADAGRPRDRNARTPMYVGASGLGSYPAPIGAGDRAEDASGIIWEAIEKSEPVKSGFLTVYYRSLVMRLGDIYPHRGDIMSQGSEIRLPDALCAIWQDGESQEDRGRYQIFSGEMPVEYEDLIDVNAKVAIEGAHYKITEHVRFLRHIDLKLRRST